mgnify:CR=1 FL=1|tara:strand:- start:715 stop:1185 length:471 start_codon:yes stop_codon:yes gene_type:complete
MILQKGSGTASAWADSSKSEEQARKRTNFNENARKKQIATDSFELWPRLKLFRMGPPLSTPPSHLPQSTGADRCDGDAERGFQELFSESRRVWMQVLDSVRHLESELRCHPLKFVHFENSRRMSFIFLRDPYERLQLFSASYGRVSARDAVPDHTT